MCALRVLEDLEMLYEIRSENFVTLYAMRKTKNKYELDYFACTDKLLIVLYKDIVSVNFTFQLK